MNSADQKSNNTLHISPMQKYRTALRRGTLFQGEVFSVETHTVFGKEMKCACIDLGNDDIKGIIYEEHFDHHKYRTLVGFIGHTVDYKVLDTSKLELPEELQVIDEENSIVLLSRIQALEELQEEFWETAKEDHVVTGKVSGYEEQRMYLLVKGVTCVLPVGDIEYDWTETAAKRFPLGSELTVKVTRIDWENKYVYVSRKETLQDPFERIYENFHVGDFYKGVVTDVVENVGVFIKLKPGIESLAWFPRKGPDLREQMIGESVSVRIKSIKKEKRQIKSTIVNFHDEIWVDEA